MRIYFNSGNRNLSFNEVILADDCSNAIDAEDVDEDGDIDIAVAGVSLVGNPNTPDSSSRLLLNASAGSFSEKIEINRN
ncbi:MAG: hypothetical protein R8P61_06940 [Bacteroidia bacterium]|nr:hypothetical protein [Bacteroidia bacterium]